MSDMISVDRRLDALEHENQALKAEIAQLKQGRRSAIPAAPVTEREVRIVETLSTSAFPMPTAAELDQLLGIVGRHYPLLFSTDGPAFSGDDADRRQQFREQFAASFLAVGNLRRLERPSTKVYLSYHIQVAEKLLRSFGRPMTLRGGPFLLAVLAHGDVPISGINRQFEGITVEVGLDEYTGRKAGDAWRQILAGQPPREVAVQRPPAPASPARVHHGF